MDVGEAYQILNLERSVVNKTDIEEVSRERGRGGGRVQTDNSLCVGSL
jgi:hypothetical protein